MFIVKEKWFIYPLTSEYKHFRPPIKIEGMMSKRRRTIRVIKTPTKHGARFTFLKRSVTTWEAYSLIFQGNPPSKHENTALLFHQTLERQDMDLNKYSAAPWFEAWKVQVSVPLMTSAVTTVNTVMGCYEVDSQSLVLSAERREQ